MPVRSWFARIVKSLFHPQPRARRSRRSSHSAWKPTPCPLEARILLTLAPQGPEFQVNTYTAGQQQTYVYFDKTPESVAIDAAGNSIVTWMSVDQDGSRWGIYAQRYDAAGAPQGAEFRVNTGTISDQINPAVAMDADGDFVITWGDDGGGPMRVVAQRFNAAGVRVGDQFVVSTTFQELEFTPSIAMNAAGDFVIGWVSQASTFDTDIYARRFNASGVPQGGDFRVNTFTNQMQLRPSVAIDAVGDFVIAWDSRGRDSGSEDYGVCGQRYNAAGIAQGSEFLVNTYTAGDQQFASAAMDADGDFVITWSSFHQRQFLEYYIYGQRYNAAGVAQGGEFPVDPESHGHISDVIMNPSGDFLVTWQGFAAATAPGIVAQRFQSDGTPFGNHFLVNTTENGGGQVYPSAAMNADGDLLVAWTDGNRDGSSTGVFAQRFVESAAYPGPQVADMRVNGQTAVANARLIAPQRLTATFDVTMSTFGTGSVTDPSNWRLWRDGVDVSALIQSITFAYNAASGLHEAVLNFSTPLPSGGYTLTARQTISDRVGNLLDGDKNGTPGGDFSYTFEVAPQQTSGSEFRINTTTAGIQSLPNDTGNAVATDANGNYVVTWSQQSGDNFDIYAQRYSASGVPQGTEFRVNAVTAGMRHGSATVAMNAAGDFVIVWARYNLSNGDYDVLGQRYNAAGVAQGGEILINQVTTSAQYRPSVAADDLGNFVVTWTTYHLGGSNTEIRGRLFSPSGVGGAEFAVNATAAGIQHDSRVAMSASGEFVITWRDDTLDGSGTGVYAQRFNPAGQPQGGEFRVNTYTAGAQDRPSVAMDDGGNFVITWSSDGQDGSAFGVYAQRFLASGQPLGGEFRVNTTTANQQLGSMVAMDADGDFVITWTSFGQEASNVGFGIYAQRYNVDGTPIGSEFQVNTYENNAQQFPNAAMDNDGDFVVAWTSFNQDGDSFGVYGQRYFGRRPVIANQTLSVMENRPVGSVVGTPVASDPDAGQSLTYAIISGNTGDVFAINPNTGQITVNAAVLNFEETNRYDLTVQVTDNGSPSVLTDTAVVTIHVTDVNEGPAVSGLPATQSVNDDATISPFSALAVTDPDTQNMLARVTILNGAVRGDFTAASTGGWTRTVSGNNIVYNRFFSPQANIGGVVQAALQTFVFDPRENAIKPNTTELTDLSVLLNDGVANTTATTRLITTSVNNAPTIGGASSTVTVNDNATVNPLATLTVIDADMQEMLISVTILNGVNRGDFTNANAGTGWTVRQVLGNNITYKRYLSAQANTGAAAQAAFRALTFQPRQNAIKPGTTELTDFQVTVSDGVAPAVANSGTRVTTTSVNNAPVISGAVANQTMNDNQTKAVFAALTVTDPDTQDQFARITITNGTLRGDFTGASSAGWTRKLSGANILYERFFSAAANNAAVVQAAIRALIFQPRNNVPVGTSETTSFTVFVNDGLITATNNTTSVITTGVAPRQASPIPTVAALLFDGDVTIVVVPSIAKPRTNLLNPLFKKLSRSSASHMSPASPG